MRNRLFPFFATWFHRRETHHISTLNPQSEGAIMVLLKRPAVPISWNNGNFGPTGYFPYPVMTGDNWENVALRDGRTHVWDLIRDNFQTDDPMEVNWYLENFVGCTVSHDGKNYSFSSTDAVKMSDGTKRRGRIFTKNDLRAVPPPPPPDDHDQLRKAMLDAISMYSGTIFGIGFSMCDFDLYGSNYRVIRDYLKDRKVGVKYDSSLGSGNAEYDSHHDLFVFSSKSFLSITQVGHLVHEMTHAVCDDRHAGHLNKQQSEAIAYVAQCLFVVKQGRTMVDSPPMQPILPTDSDVQRRAKYRKFAIGTDIAQKIVASGRNVDKNDEARMLWAIKNDGEGTGSARYDGIDRTPYF
jgi:hypothetical protein